MEGRDGSLVTELPQQSTLTTVVAEDRWAQIRGEKGKRRRGSFPEKKWLLNTGGKFGKVGPASRALPGASAGFAH
jgi:hypothetical protein